MYNVTCETLYAKVVVLLTDSNLGDPPTQTNHREQVTYIPAASAGWAQGTA